MKNDYKYILVELLDNHLKITLNRKEKRNALNSIMIRELNESFEEAGKDENVGSITLTGAGTAFCSGADLQYLKDLKTFDRNKNKEDSSNLARLFFTIYSVPKPVIAAVNGPAIAGGCGLATVCDFIIASENAVFGYPEVKIGFVAALVSIFLIRQIGERRARELLLTGKLLSATDAFKMGLINRVTPVDQLHESVTDLCNLLVRNSSQATAISKSLFTQFGFTDIKKELDKFSDINVKARETSHFLEGINSFLEKRKPSWQ